MFNIFKSDLRKQVEALAKRVQDLETFVFTKLGEPAPRPNLGGPAPPANPR